MGQGKVSKRHLAGIGRSGRVRCAGRQQDRPCGFSFETPDDQGARTKGVWIIGGNQKTREEAEEEKGAVTEKFYPENHPTLTVLDIVKTTDFTT